MADGVRMSEKVIGKMVESKPKTLVKGQIVPSKAAQPKGEADVKEK